MDGRPPGREDQLLAEAQSLSDALGAKQMEEYQTDLTGALADISLAVGRQSQAGMLGGLEGALATALGIPAGSKIVSGCDVPAEAPADGVTAGKLAYLSVDRRAAATALPDEFPVRRIDVVGDRLVLYTLSTRESATLCGRRSTNGNVSQRSHPRRERTRAVASASLVSHTATQARAGATVYAQKLRLVSRREPPRRRGTGRRRDGAHPSSYGRRLDGRRPA